MTQPNTEPKPTTDTEIADLNGHSCYSAGCPSDACYNGSWIDNLIARIEQEREMRRELARVGHGFAYMFQNHPGGTWNMLDDLRSALARAAKMEADNGK